ncbi:MAG: TetR/AcrR family transcriptional regulator [Thermodesulfobacteriota bacterium]|nr:TetR/AcrR family transcriptional regulator [Thermodesulfobacteriota bacterium]
MKNNPKVTRKKIEKNCSHADVPTQIKNPDLVRERRKQIVDSTVHLFVEHGYHKTTTRMIAKAAGFSIGSLYEYVGSKEDVLYLVCQAIHTEVEKAVEDALKGAEDGKASIAEIIREYFLVCDKMMDPVILMYQVTQFLPAKWKSKVLENELIITQIFIDALNCLSGKGDLPRMDKTTISLVGHNISVLGHMWAFRRWHLAKEFTIESYIKYQTQFVLGLIFKDKGK